MAQRVMVVGGTGNMSTAIVRLLLDRGYDVSIYCRGQSVLPPHPDARVVIGDRTDRTAYIQLMRQGNYDFAIDMICRDLQDAQDDYAAFPDVGRLVFCSTAGIYGELPAAEMPICEHYSLTLPTWKYGLIKRQAEDFLLGKYLEKRYPVTIIRPSVTFGRMKQLVRQIGMDNVWIDRIRKGKPIITGNPYIMRNFLHADDAAYAFAGAIEQSVCIGQTYNMVGLKPYDWQTYHRTMMKVVGRESEMIEVPLETMLANQSATFKVSDLFLYSYRYNSYLSGEKIARDIPDFRVRTSLEQGLAQAVDFIERQNLIPDSEQYPGEDEIIRLQLATRH
ncbi:MAG: NAD-dependent epimerase/dehydratase family protein [Bacillota bacterium]|nr:NAD-dependent epimerase/dehydratase family protein [Bacillota bacterium]